MYSDRDNSIFMCASHDIWIIQGTAQLILKAEVTWELDRHFQKDYTSGKVSAKSLQEPSFTSMLCRADEWVVSAVSKLTVGCQMFETLTYATVLCCCYMDTRRQLLALKRAASDQLLMWTWSEPAAWGTCWILVGPLCGSFVSRLDDRRFSVRWPNAMLVVP
jgi:hypothetical protein